jgi:hypothetical protein
MDYHDYIQAAKGDVILDRTPADRAELISMAVDRAFTLRGMAKPDTIARDFIVTELDKKISTNYRYLTAQELTYIAEMGVAGELTRDMKPTASAFFGWIAAYMNSDARKEALREYQRNLRWNGEHNGPTQNDVAELNRQAEVRALNALWAEFCTHGRILETEHFRGYVAMAMDGFEKRGYMKLTPENWDAARKLVRKHAHRFNLHATGYRAAAPDVPDSALKWTMLEMCFQGLKNGGYDFKVTA